DGTTTFGTATLTSSAASFSSSSLAVATHSITAIYAGDASNIGSTSSALSQTVNTQSTTTTLASSVNPSTFGQTVTWTATVMGSSPSGTVTFKDGTTTLGTATLASGAASFASAAFNGGTHSITAVYAGDSNNTTSTFFVLMQTINA